MRLETVGWDALRAAYARDVGRPCVFVDFIDGTVDSLVREVQSCFPDLTREQLTEAVRMSDCVISFDKDIDAARWMWSTKTNNAFMAQAFSADGSKLL
jgi:hypothetical protein